MKLTSDQQEDLDINITPLIDVVFLLLIFFMVSTTFQKESRLSIELPQASAQQQVQDQGSITISISREGDYAIAGKKLANNEKSTLHAVLSKIAQQNKDRKLILRADSQTPYQAVVNVMDITRRIGLNKLSIATVHDNNADNP